MECASKPCLHAIGDGTGLQDEHGPQAKPRQSARQQPHSTEPETDFEGLERSFSCSQELLRNPMSYMFDDGEVEAVVAWLSEGY